MGDKYSQYSDEELGQKSNTFKTLIVVMMVVEMLFFAWIAYTIVAGKEINFLVIVPAMTVGVGGMLPAVIGLAAIREELNKRSNKQDS